MGHFIRSKGHFQGNPGFGKPYAVFFPQQRQHGTVIEIFLQQIVEAFRKMGDFQLHRNPIGIADALDGDDFCPRPQIQKSDIFWFRVLDHGFDDLGVGLAADFAAHIGKAARGDDMVVVFLFADKSPFALLAQQQIFLFQLLQRAAHRVAADMV